MAKLLKRAGHVKALSESGLSVREITQKTGFTATVVKNYLSSDFSPVNAHVDEFKSLLKAKNADELLLRMDKVALLALPELDAFVNGLKQDIDAVINAFTTDFSNGLVEGTVNKIKVIKRIMYGRCRFSLLRRKCLLYEYLK